MDGRTAHIEYRHVDPAEIAGVASRPDDCRHPLGARVNRADRLDQAVRTGERLTYDDIRGNAFYCGGEDDDYIAYDAAYLMPRLNESFGALTPAVVLAHEFGHAVQHRAEVDAPSVVIELQADCFAGAWVAYAQTSASDPVTVEETALDSSIRAIPLLRDQPGTAATNPKAHGLGFDRVNAFQTG